MSDSTRAKILKAASSLVEAGPASEFSTREVARAVGLSVSVVHYHFQNREGLLRAVYDAAYYDGLLALADLLRSDLSSGQTFEAVVRVTTVKVFRYCRSRGQLFRNYLANVVERGDLGSGYDLEQQDRLLRLVTPFVRKETQVSVAEARLRISVLVMLAARLATSNERELGVITQSETPMPLVEAMLSDAAVRILLG